MDDVDQLALRRMMFDCDVEVFACATIAAARLRILANAVELIAIQTNSEPDGSVVQMLVEAAEKHACQVHESVMADMSRIRILVRGTGGAEHAVAAEKG